MKKIYLLLFGLAVFTSCTQKVVLESKTYSKSAKKSCAGKTNCAFIELKVLQAKDKKVVADSINNAIFRSARELIYAGEEPNSIQTYADLTNFFVSDFEAMQSDLKQVEMISWEAKLNVKKEYESKSILNFAIDSYVFMGGAHGYESVKSLCFDTETGKLIPASSLFTDLKEVNRIVETNFRKNQKIDSAISLNEAGYMFDNGLFVLPENIIFTEKGMRFHYNPYEVASYAQGEIEFEIPYSEIETYLKIKR